MYSKLKADFSQCDSIPYTNSTGSKQTAGSAVVINGKLGILYEDVEDGESTVAIVEVPGPGIMLPKAAAFAPSGGAEITWDVVDGEVNGDTTNNTVIGYAYRSAAGADNEVQAVLQNVNGVS